MSSRISVMRPIPFSSSADAIIDVRDTLLRALQRCEELQMGLCSAGTHPFCRRLALITPLPRYQKVESDAGILSHTQITYSAHVHVGMASGDEAMHVMSRLIPAVPVFMAMSANSAFWRGHDTGHAAYRHRILAAARYRLISGNHHALDFCHVMQRL